MAPTPLRRLALLGLALLCALLAGRPTLLPLPGGCCGADCDCTAARANGGSCCETPEEPAAESASCCAPPAAAEEPSCCVEPPAASEPVSCCGDTDAPEPRDDGPTLRAAGCLCGLGGGALVLVRVEPPLTPSEPARGAPRGPGALRCERAEIPSGRLGLGPEPPPPRTSA